MNYSPFFYYQRAIFQGSLVFGNLFLYSQLKGKREDDIESFLRYRIYFVLSIVCGLGCLLLLGLGKTTSRTITADPTNSSQTDPISAFKKCLRLFKTRKMLLLSIACFYSGKFSKLIRFIDKSSVKFLIKNIFFFNQQVLNYHSTVESIQLQSRIQDHLIRIRKSILASMVA